MPQSSSQKGPTQTDERKDALDALISFKIPKKEAEDLARTALGTTSGEIVTNAIRIRGGKSQIPPGAGPGPKGAMPVAPAVQAAAPPPPPQPVPAQPPPQAQPQIPGFGPPGGTQAAPTAEQLQQQAKQAFLNQYFGGPAPRLPQMFQRLFGRGGQPQPPAGPPPAPVAQAGSTAPGSTASPPPPVAAMPMPAPVKPRIRVKAAGGKIPEAPTPTEAVQAKEKAAGTEEVPHKEAKPEGELPLVSTQEEYDKLPIGARFKHPDGYVYRKESQSAEAAPPQGQLKMQTGGVVPQPGEAPELASWRQPSPETTSQAPKSTDTVPAQLTPGEYVVPKGAVEAAGPENLDALTAALLQKRAGASGAFPYQGASTAATAGRTPVGPTGQTVDASGHPVLRALAYGPNSEGATAADMRQVKGAFVDKLQTGDIAISPNLLKLYPALSRVNVVDSKGNIVLPNARVADTSWISEGHPTENTFEIWNGPSLGRGYHLVPVAA